MASLKTGLDRFSPGENSMQNQQTDHLADLLETARKWSDGGLGVAICTVVATWGSSPRQPGAQLIVDDEGHFMGSVSGG